MVKVKHPGVPGAGPGSRPVWRWRWWRFLAILSPYPCHGWHI